MKTAIIVGTLIVGMAIFGQSPSKPEVTSPYVVQGIIFDVAGKPAPQATVWLAVTHWETRIPELIGKTFSDDSGRFAFDTEKKVEPRDTLNVIVAHLGAAITFENVASGPGERIVQLNKEGKARIRLLDPDGKPLAGALVRANPNPLSALIDESATKTDRNGIAVLDGLPVHSNISVIIESNLYTTLPFELRSSTSGEEGPLFTIQTRQAPSLRGRILTTNKKPAANLSLALYRQKGDRVTRLAFEVKTDKSGRFLFPQLEAGDFQIEAQPSSDIPEASGASWTVTVGKSDQNAGDLEIGKGGHVRGVVLDLNGAPLTNLPLSFYRKGNHARNSVQCLTDSHGRFQIRLIEGGYSLFAPGYMIRNDQGSANENGWIDIEEGERRTFEFRLERNTAPSQELRPRASGQVVNSSGAPVSGAIVQGGTEWVMTGSDGRFVFSPQLMPSQAVSAVHPKFGMALDKPLANPIALSGTALVWEGRIVDEDGKPVPEAVVYVYKGTKQDGSGMAARNAMPRLIDEIYADANGHYRIDRVALSDLHRLTVRAKGYQSATVVFPAQTGAFTMVSNVRLQKALEKASGVVVDEKGAPMSNVMVTSNSDYGAVTVTDEAGRFELSGLAQVPTSLSFSVVNRTMIGKQMGGLKPPYRIVLPRGGEKP